MSRVQVRSTYFSIEQIASERRAWRLRKVQFFEREERRDRRVNGLCEQSWRNFCEALHREVIQRNDLGRPILGIRRSENRFEVHPAGKLAAFLVVELDRENVQIAYRSLLHEGSVILDEEGGIATAAAEKLLLSDLDGRLIRFGCAEAAQFLLEPIALS